MVRTAGSGSGTIRRNMVYQKANRFIAGPDVIWAEYGKSQLS
jgi:hypothetical protein